MGSFAFSYVFDYPGLDYQVPLFSFLFLVALGVDYNIFLVSRAKQETVHRGTRQGIIHALAVTGGVITSAGILLAAVFTVLGVLPVSYRPRSASSSAWVCCSTRCWSVRCLSRLRCTCSATGSGRRDGCLGPRHARSASELSAHDDVAPTTEPEPRRALL